MKHIIAGIILGATALVGAANAQTYRAENRLVVTSVGNGSFSVPTSGKFGARGAWCAAGRYAADVLGAPGNARVYVQKAKQSNSSPVIFGLDPAGATPVGVLGTTSALRTAGSNLSIDHVTQFCQDRILSESR